MFNEISEIGLDKKNFVVYKLIKKVVYKGGSVFIMVEWVGVGWVWKWYDMYIFFLKEVFFYYNEMFVWIVGKYWRVFYGFWLVFVFICVVMF